MNDPIIGPISYDHSHMTERAIHMLISQVGFMLRNLDYEFNRQPALLQVYHVRTHRTILITVTVQEAARKLTTMHRTRIISMNA